jgi:hypothetical protein
MAPIILAASIACSTFIDYEEPFLDPGGFSFTAMDIYGDWMIIQGDSTNYPMVGLSYHLEKYSFASNELKRNIAVLYSPYSYDIIDPDYTLIYHAGMGLTKWSIENLITEEEVILLDLFINNEKARLLTSFLPPNDRDAPAIYCLDGSGIRFKNINNLDHGWFERNIILPSGFNESMKLKQIVRNPTEESYYFRFSDSGSNNGCVLKVHFPAMTTEYILNSVNGLSYIDVLSDGQLAYLISDIGSEDQIIFPGSVMGWPSIITFNDDMDIRSFELDEIRGRLFVGDRTSGSILEVIKSLSAPKTSWGEIKNKFRKR